MHSKYVYSICNEYATSKKQMHTKYIKKSLWIPQTCAIWYGLKYGYTICVHVIYVQNEIQNEKQGKKQTSMIYSFISQDSG